MDIASFDTINKIEFDESSQKLNLHFLNRRFCRLNAEGKPIGKFGDGAFKFSLRQFPFRLNRRKNCNLKFLIKFLVVSGQL